jgi:hypothetical protein
MTRRLTDKPLGVGVTILMPGARENAEVVIEEKVPVVIINDVPTVSELIERIVKEADEICRTMPEKVFFSPSFGWEHRRKDCS